MKLVNTRLIAATSLALLLVACGGEATDEAAPVGEAPTEIAERQDNFEAIKDNFMVIRANFEEGAETDLAAVEAAARDISDRAGRIDQYFPEGSGIDAGWDTEALASIWEQPAEFTGCDHVGQRWAPRRRGQLDPTLDRRPSHRIDDDRQLGVDCR